MHGSPAAAERKDDIAVDRWTLRRPRDAMALPVRLGRALRHRGYRSRLYRFRLSGRHPLRLLGSPEDPWPGDAAAGAALLAGEEGDFWAASPGGHGFDWLRDLAATGDAAAARRRAETLLRSWLARHEQPHPEVWAPALTGCRLRNWFFHAPLILATHDLVYRSAVLNSMARQARHLARTTGDPDTTAERVGAAVGLILAGLLLPHGEGWQRRGEAQLKGALGDAVLADGGPASRRPADLMAIMRDLVSLRLAYEERAAEAPLFLQHTLDRTGPFLRALRHGDGALAHIGGAGREPPALIDRLLTASLARGRPVDNARYSGLMRLKARRTLVLFDCMPPPAFCESRGAHAGTLAFELSDGPDRIVVNIGPACSGVDSLVRTTAAHSTLVVADRNSTQLRDDGGLGEGVEEIVLERHEGAEAITVEARHDGYRRRLRLDHVRRIALSRDGRLLSGLDRLEPVGRGPRRAVSFDIRFHLHPGTVASLTQDGTGVLLRLPGRHGWMFRVANGVTSLEESLYVVGDGPRRARQIVVHGETSAGGAELCWSFERMDRRGGQALEA